MSYSIPSTRAAIEVRTAWERFVSGDPIPADVVPDEIRESWYRSRKAGVSPSLRRFPRVLGDDELELKRRENRHLIAASHDAIGHLSGKLSADVFGAGITDGNGRLLYMYGPPSSSAELEEVNAIPGAEWREEMAGTMSSSLVLRFGKPFQVYWFENYIEMAHEWAGCSAPIHGKDGDLIGVLGVSGYRTPVHAQAFSLVVATAAQIERRVDELMDLDRLAVLEAFTRQTLKFPESPMLAFDSIGRLRALSPSMAGLARLSSPGQLIGKHHDQISEFTFENPLAISIGFNQSEQSGTLIVGSSSDASYKVDILPIRSPRDDRIGSVVIVSDSHRPAGKRSDRTSWRATHTFHDLIGRSPAFRTTVEMAETVARHDRPVMLIGESGTGKELFAQAIHNSSDRAAGPFVALNCSVIPRELAAAELFGYDDGAFSGAARGGKRGKVEIASRGTLFLDELADMPIEIQPLFLRFLEEGQIAPLGSERTRSTDVRVIVATSTNPLSSIADGKLRLDLYHRLNLFPITLVPLRERLKDLPLLIEHFLRIEGFSNQRVSPEVIEAFSRYRWSGNVRELRNIIIRAATLNRGGEIGLPEMPPEIAFAQAGVSHLPGRDSVKPGHPGDERVLEVLASNGGNISETARQLGIHRVTIHRKLRALGLR